MASAIECGLPRLYAEALRPASTRRIYSACAPALTLLAMLCAPCNASAGQAAVPASPPATVASPANSTPLAGSASSTIATPLAGAASSTIATPLAGAASLATTTPLATPAPPVGLALTASGHLSSCTCGDPTTGAGGQGTATPAPGTGATEAPTLSGPMLRRGSLRAASWSEVSALGADAISPASWEAFLLGCGVLRADPLWAPTCAAAGALTAEPDAATRLDFFRTHLQPWQALGGEGQLEGLATGYYEPVLHGSRFKSERFRYPLYARPDDLLTVDLGSLIPELRGRRLRARLDGNRVVPYYSRSEIEHNHPETLNGREIVWIDDPVEVFFLHIQGSGRVELAEGGGIHVGYADQNGQPFKSVARFLIDRGELSVAQASLQGMKAWASAHPDRVDTFLDANPSYVFFRELPGSLPGPIGTLGVPLIGDATVAVDAKVIPLGAPVFVDTTYPLSQQALRRVAMAQDTGGAINGAVRVDYFWGLGDQALEQAGRMRQKLRMWVFLPPGTHPLNGVLVSDNDPQLSVHSDPVPAAP